MSIARLKNLHNYIYAIYFREINIMFDNNKHDDFHSYVNKKEVHLPKSIIANPTEWTLFAFMHEIGHIQTNVSNMKRCMQEYLATQWALDKSKEIGFAVPTIYISTYQNYIWRWRDKSIKANGKNVPTKEELTLSY